MKLAALRPKIRFEKKWSELVASLLHAATFILGGMLLARWIWLLFSPTIPVVPPALEPAVSSQSATILAARWFTPKTGGINVAIPSAVNFTLIGTYAPTNSKLGFAIFKLVDGKQRFVLLNQEISPGIRLQSIKQEEVQVGQEGSTQTLVLENRKPNSAATAPVGIHF